jgi:outer membrane protein OmpA-like peptidoglycan-associated protein
VHGVHFDFNKYNIRPGDAAVLDEAAATLKDNPNVRVEVNGYTDSIGSADYNLRLSETRAGAVVAYLVDHGIPADRLVPAMARQTLLLPIAPKKAMRRIGE